MRPIHTATFSCPSYSKMAPSTMGTSAKRYTVSPEKRFCFLIPNSNTFRSPARRFQDVPLTIMSLVCAMHLTMSRLLVHGS